MAEEKNEDDANQDDGEVHLTLHVLTNKYFQLI